MQLKQTRNRVAAIFLFALSVSVPIVASADSLQGSEWLFQGIKNGEQWLIDESDQAYRLSISDSQISGETACNRFIAEFNQDAFHLSIGPPATTRMLCIPESMEAETELLQRLATVSSFSRDEHLLYLWFAADQALVYRRSVIDKEEKPRNYVDFESCLQAESRALIGIEENQCVVDEKVFFEDERPPISLEFCTEYFDGCSRYGVKLGRLTFSSIMDCDQESGPPVCFILKNIYAQGIGQVVAMRPGEIDVTVGERSESFPVTEYTPLDDIQTGDQVMLEYSYDPSGVQSPVLLEIMPY